MKATVFFDLDGTLVDSHRGIFGGAAYALCRLGYAARSEDISTDFIGPPLYDTFRALYGMDDATARRAVALYREYYSEQGIYENDLYPGIEELLDALSRAGVQLALATGKPLPFAERVLSHLGLRCRFAAVFGTGFDGTYSDKADLLSHALTELSLPPSLAVMVGDRSFDMQAAVSTGIYPLGALWGFGSREELLGAGARAIAETPVAAQGLLLSRIAAP